jgi:hypothetical protein
MDASHHVLPADWASGAHQLVFAGDADLRTSGEWGVHDGEVFSKVKDYPLALYCTMWPSVHWTAGPPAGSKQTGHSKSCSVPWLGLSFPFVFNIGCSEYWLYDSGSLQESQP